MGGQYAARSDSSVSRLPASGAVFRACLVRGNAARLCCRRRIVAGNRPCAQHPTFDGDFRLCGGNERALGADLRLCAVDAGNSFTGAERMRTIVLPWLLATVLAGRALAHGGEAHGPEATWT